MNIYPIPAFTDNYIWTLINNNAAICVDPGDSQPVLEFLNQKKITLAGLLITHHHWDHTGGIEELIHRYPGIVVYGPDDPRINGINHIVKPEQDIECFGLSMSIMSTPGHTSTHISYYERDSKMLFCGDTLFSAGCGRVFDGTIEDLHQSLERLKKLPDSTKIYCAHEYTRQNLRFAATVEPENSTITDYLEALNRQPAKCTLPSTIGLEKQINPFLRTDSEAVVDYVKQRGTHCETTLDVFKQLRADKNQFR